MTENTLTLAEAARMMRDALKDRSYRATPLGLEVARYYRWKKNEWGARDETLRDYDAILAKLALDHADLELADFEPPVGTERLREFIDNRWGDPCRPHARKGHQRTAGLLLVPGAGTTDARQPGAPDRSSASARHRSRNVLRE